MAPTPRPDGWKGGSEDFGILRTLDGNLGINVNSDPDFASDLACRSNVKWGFDASDLGGAQDVGHYDDFRHGA